MTGYGEIKLVFKNDKTLINFPLYSDSGSIDLSIGQIAFKIPENKYADIKRIYETGVNVFYVTSLIQNITSVVYTGLFKIYDNTSNVAQLNEQAANANPSIKKDPDLPKEETAVVTRRSISTETTPTMKPGKSVSDSSLRKNQ